MESLQKHPMTVFEYMEHNKIVIDSKYIKLFWVILSSNNSMIYLSDEIILSQMTNSKSKSAISDFINRKLIKCVNYTKGIDYIIINKDHELVKCYSTNSQSNKKKDNIGKGQKKYYAVSLNTLKTLLMKTTSSTGNHTRNYFIQIETLYIQYTKYQCEFYKTNFEEHKQKLIDESVIHTRRIRIKELEENLYQKYKIGCVYYIKCGDYTKIGYTFNLPERLQTLQVANPIKLIVVKTELCQFPNIRETYLHKKYKHLCVRGEWFNI
jgi:phage anti-repressor protein